MKGFKSGDLIRSIVTVDHCVPCREQIWGEQTRGREEIWGFFSIQIIKNKGKMLF